MLNRIVTACVWVSDLLFAKKVKMLIGFIFSSGFKPIGEVNVSQYFYIRLRHAKCNLCSYQDNSRSSHRA